MRMSLGSPFTSSRKQIVNAVMTVLSCSTMNAIAQESAPGALEEIIVTAERRATAAETTPISMTAITGEQLNANQPMKDLVDIQAMAPGLTVTNAGNFNFINIRGLGNSTSASVVSSGVAVFIDGLLEPEMQGVGGALYDMQGIEILRGPQGTFVGQSSVGGAILINSKAPTLDNVEGNVELTFGNYSQRRAAGGVNLPMTDTLAMRVAFNLEERDSFYKNVGTSAIKPLNNNSEYSTPGNLNELDSRVSFLWQPNDAFKAILRVTNEKRESDGLPQQPIPGSGFYQYSSQTPYVLNYDWDNNFRRQTFSRNGLELNYTFDNGMVLRSVSGYQRSTQEQCNDGDASSVNSSGSCFWVTPKEYYSEDVSLISSTDGAFDWIAGAAYFHRKAESGTTNYVFPTPYRPYVAPSSVSTTYRTVTQEQVMAYAQAGYDLTDSWRIEVGARLNDDYNEAMDVSCACTNDSSTTTPTGKIGLNWTPIDGQFFYGFFSRGYKTGGVNTIRDPSGTNPLRSFNPEEVDDYELGWKGRLMDGRVLMELGAYYMEYADMQYPTLNPGNGRFSTVTNIGEATIQGVDFALRSRFGDLGIDASASYNDSELGGVTVVAEYALPPPGAGNLGGQCGFPGVTGACFDYSSYYRTLSGSRSPYSPEWQATLSLSYNFAVGENVLRPSVTYSYVGEQWGSVFQKQLGDYYLMGERKLIDASLNYEAGQWVTQLYGKNLTDEVYVAGFGTGENLAYGNPRQYGIRIKRDF